MVPFPSLSGSLREFSSDMYYRNLVEFPGINLVINVGASLRLWELYKH